MRPDLHQARAIFLHAVGKLPPEQWDAYVSRACAGDTGLSSRVRHLLDAHREAGSFLDRPAVGPAETVSVDDPVLGPSTVSHVPQAEELGGAVGPYKLVQEIDEGGMGTVYLAQQSEPVKRLVALKVIKAGMDSRAVLGRFEAERQALALMDHPNIAKVLDAGATPSGRPYFVMELVKGVPITRYCDDHKLAPTERLELFVQVCGAVQHSHQKGIIHRDLKPSNVLVAPYDGKPVAKVIDFGIAKAVGQPLTERTLVTGLGAVVGTPEYMSPEQAALNNQDIDTRSDVYSLGILLYELLTGTTPLTKKRVKDTALLEVLRLVREEEPPRPSTRLSTTDESPSIAANRGVEPRKLSRLLRGELDWIVMKALEKDRNRRYETANAFAADVQRYLVGEAVQAVPPSAGYRLRKFARRNRLQVVTAALIFSALLVGLAGSVWGLVQADVARRAAVAAEQDAQEKRRAAEVAEAKEAEQRKVAEAEARLAQDVQEFLRNDILRLADPSDQYDEGFAMPYAQVRLRDVILRAAERIEGRFKDRPLVEMNIRGTLGYALHGMGHTDLALKQWERVRELCVNVFGPDRIETHRAELHVAACYSGLGRRQEALNLTERIYSRSMAKLGPDDITTLKAALELARCFSHVGRIHEALKLREETLARWKATVGPDHRATISIMDDLADSYGDMGRFNEARKLREKVVSWRKINLGRDHPATLDGMSRLVHTLELAGHHTEALKLMEETLALGKIAFGEDNIRINQYEGRLAVVYINLDRFEEGRKLIEKVLAFRKRTRSPDHPDTLTCMRYLAACLRNLGKLDDAMKLGQEALALFKSKLGVDNPDTCHMMFELARTHYEMRQYDEAQPLFEQVLKVWKDKLGPDHPDTIVGMRRLSHVHSAKGRHKEAITLHEEALSLSKARLGPDDLITHQCMHGLAVCLLNSRRYADALERNKELLALRKIKLGEGHRETIATMFNLSICFAHVHGYAAALKLREEVFALSNDKLGPKHSMTLDAMENLASNYSKVGQWKEAVRIGEDLLERRRAISGPDHPRTLLILEDLANDYGSLGQHDDALKLYQEGYALTKVKLGEDHQDTFVFRWRIVSALVSLGREKEALPMIDELEAQATRRSADPTRLPYVTGLRTMYLKKTGDLEGLRKTAESFEKLNRQDSHSLYCAGCCRAVLAQMLGMSPEPDAAKLANEEADKAMVWLTKSVAAGYKDRSKIEKDADLNSLRDRDDFKKLVASIPANTPEPPSK